VQSREALDKADIPCKPNNKMVMSKTEKFLRYILESYFAMHYSHNNYLQVYRGNKLLMSCELENTENIVRDAIKQGIAHN
jgi:hypothetical protein